MPIYVEVVVNVPQVADVFHYHLPSELEGQVLPGCLLEVPFGRQRVQAVALRRVESPAVSETRPVLALLDPQPVVTPVQIELARRMAQETLAPLAACMRLMIPSALEQQADVEYALHLSARAGKAPRLSESQKRLLALLEKRGALRGRQIDAALPRQNWRSSAQVLLKAGLLAARAVLPAPSGRARTVRTVQLAVSLEAAEQALPSLGRAGSAAAERRQAALRYLMGENGPQEASWVYAESGATPEDLRKLAEMGLAVISEMETYRDPLAKVETVSASIPELTRDQRQCWDALENGLRQAAAGRRVVPFLLHGVTGSGKTEIYLRAVAAVLAVGRQAIVLVPEIALTPQTVQRFLGRFPGQVGLLHSQLSEGERFDTWRRARQGQIGVVVGPRSALFTPFPNVGLVVVDECHDDSYYQSEPPFYDARPAAMSLAALAGGVCVLGSATPDIAHTYQAAQGHWQYLRLPQRVAAHRQAAEAAGAPVETNSRGMLELPPVRVVDMRDELKSGNRSIFSRALQTGLTQVLERKQQAILFLNRRGTATHVFCRECGHTLKCPRCDLPLTYHSPQDALLCHYCGYQRNMPHACPECKSPHIRQFGTGTERVEAEVQQMFPAARTLRWDYETTRKRGAHEAILSHFAAHRADVLVGTQMLAKGLDLPLVTLVGVVLADVGLGLPDFSAPERAYQLLTQVAGRAGRSALGGEVILQTFQPENYVVQAAAASSYRQFYQQELEYRRRLGYPPFARLLRLEFRHASEDEAQAVATKLAGQIKDWIEAEGQRATEIIGPAPCFFGRVSGIYRWQVVVRGPDPAALLRGRVLPGWRIEVDPPSLL
jgi:primosomal protein N' (replication factor Y)